MTLPSYQITPRTLQNHYGINLGTESLIIKAQTREEIFADKLLAFAMRPGRIKYRDVWDIGWLAQNGIEPALDLLNAKLADHGELEDDFLIRSDERLGQLVNDEQQHRDFVFEMTRFIPPDRLDQTLRQEGFWTYLSNTVIEKVRQAQNRVESDATHDTGPSFLM